MFCKQCGGSIAEFTDFCPLCGDEVNKKKPMLLKQYTVDEKLQIKARRMQTILILGIIGFALSFATVWQGGLVVSWLALHKSTWFAYEYGPVKGRAKVGRVLAVNGLVLSLVQMVLVIAYFVYVCIYRA